MILLSCFSRVFSLPFSKSLKLATPLQSCPTVCCDVNSVCNLTDETSGQVSISHLSLVPF